MAAAIATTERSGKPLVLGSLCRRGHDHEGTGQSTRLPSGHCYQCRLLAGAAQNRRRYSTDNKTEAQMAYQRRYQREYAKAKRKSDPEWARTIDQRTNERNKVRRKVDATYATKMRLRSRLSNALRLYAKGGKVCRSDEYGIDYVEIIKHLGPCPGPVEDYHIDHIRPLVSFDLDDPEEVRQAFAPENHQWLTKDENLSKGSSCPTTTTTEERADHGGI